MPICFAISVSDLISKFQIVSSKICQELQFGSNFHKNSQSRLLSSLSIALGRVIYNNCIVNTFYLFATFPFRALVPCVRLTDGTVRINSSNHLMMQMGVLNPGPFEGWSIE